MILPLTNTIRSIHRPQNPRQRGGIAALAEIDSTKCCPKGERSESMRRQRCQGLPASATPLSIAVGCSNVHTALDSGVVGAKGLRLAPLPPHSTTLSRFALTLMMWFISSVFGAAQQTSTPGDWPGKPFDMVIGYQFANPWGCGGLLSEKGIIDLDDLRWLQARSVKLEKPQVDFLLKHTFASEKKSVPAACYEAHHVFVFYSKDQPVAAIELCFQCNSARCRPNADIFDACNIPQLRHLCALLKLGTKPPETSDEIIKNYLADPVRKARYDNRLPKPFPVAPAPVPQNNP